MKQLRAPVGFSSRISVFATALLAFCGALTVVTLAGCSGGGSSPAATARTQQPTGTAVFSINWPKPAAMVGRLIPLATQSIDLRLTSADGKRLYGDTLLVRPAGGGLASATFNNVPVGTATLAATAYPNADGSGNALASAQAPVVVVANQNTAVSLTMMSTIKTLTVTPATATLKTAQTETVMATATDASGNVVLFTSGTLTWASSAPSTAVVDVTGKVTAIAAGTATITATETESGVTGTAAVTVSSPSPPANPPLIYDGFAYTAGQYLTGQNGGIGWGGAWASHGYDSTPSVTVAGSLSYMNLATTGGAYQTTSDGPIGDDRNVSPTMGIPGQVLYLSTLMKPIDALNAGSPDTYFDVYIGNAAFGVNGGSSNFSIQMDNDKSAYVKSNVVAQQNATYFIVVRATFGTTSNTYDLFVNPTPGQPLPSTPDAMLVYDAATLQALHYGTSIRCVFDELRVGSAYADVSPTN